MKLREIFRFEFAYQLRRPWPWLSMLVLTVFAMQATRSAIVPVTLPKDFILNSPFIITAVSVFTCQIWLLLAPAVAGEAAARDVHTGMHPLIYSSPVSKLEYLGGRFLAALALNAIILLGVQIGSLLAVYGPGANPDIVGPFRPLAYLSAYGFIALTNALIATTFQFAAASVSGRPMAAYVGSLMLFFLSYPVTFALYLGGLGKRALVADPIGVMAIMNEMMSNWTIVEKNVRMFTLEGSMLLNRVVWVGIALTTVLVVYARFRFAHRTAIDPLAWLKLRFAARRPKPATTSPGRVTLTVPQVAQTFGLATYARQTWSTTWSSFRLIVTSPGGLFMLIAFPLLLTFVVFVETEHWSIPLLPSTSLLLAKHLTGILVSPNNYWMMVPLFIVFFAGELVWRERDARMSENVDATPVPDWVLYLGKFVGLALFLIMFLIVVALVGITVQVLRGHYDFQLGRYAQVLLGLQLTDYLLFTALVFAVHVVVNHKYVAPLVALVVFSLMIFASYIGIEHNLFIYASGPAWSMTDMRPLGPSLGPWLWFRLYWAAWALLLAVVARLFWTRGRETGAGARLQLARLRMTRPTASVAALAVVLILTFGGFIFYNTNVLNRFISAEEGVRMRADYERLYGKYEGIPQPERKATRLHIEIYPERGAAAIRGSYVLVNRDTVPIDTLHVGPAIDVGTTVRLDRPSRQVLADERLGHLIYALETPLQPGDSMTMDFDLKLERRGFSEPSDFRNNGAGRGILPNGTYFADGALPIIGYQQTRELWSAADRRKYGLPRQVTLAAPSDIEPNMAAGATGTFDAVIGTSAAQTAVAPGELKRAWNEGGRSYFQYVSAVPMVGTDVFFSAKYALHRERWRHVDIQVYLHPGHSHHFERVMRSVRASLDYYSEQFGPYPHHFLQIVEQPGNFLGMGVDGSGVITGGEGFFHLNPKGDGFDMIFEVVGHEMGHQWWGMQLRPAFAEGGGVISESLAWYSTMQLVKKEKGREALRRLMVFMRQPNPWPQIRTGMPLLRAMDPWANYRKGPYAMHALTEYVGEARVNGALRTLIQKKASSLATTLDMYRELQAVTPDSLKPLLRDLFETNTFWTFDTKSSTAKQMADGTYQVTFEVDAHKIVADTTGVETEVPVTDMVEIGVFAAAQPGAFLGKPLYVQKHKVRTGKQTITVTVPSLPARGGIDPYNLLDWEEGDNIETIVIPRD